MVIGLLPTAALVVLMPYWILDYYGFVSRGTWIHENFSFTPDFSLFQGHDEKNSNKDSDSNQSDIIVELKQSKV